VKILLIKNKIMNSTCPYLNIDPRKYMTSCPFLIAHGNSFGSNIRFRQQNTSPLSSCFSSILKEWMIFLMVLLFVIIFLSLLQFMDSSSDEEEQDQYEAIGDDLEYFYDQGVKRCPLFAPFFEKKKKVKCERSNKHYIRDEISDIKKELDSLYFVVKETRCKCKEEEEDKKEEIDLTITTPACCEPEPEPEEAPEPELEETPEPEQKEVAVPELGQENEDAK